MSSRWWVSGGLSLALVIGCSAGSGGGRRPRPGSDAGPSDGGGGRAEVCNNAVDDDGDGATDCADDECAPHPLCSGGDGGGGGVDAGACRAENFEAMGRVAPVDVIFVVDSSGSMDEEAGFVQSEMLDFAHAFEGSAINFRIVVMSAAGFVRIGAPLGTDPMRFRYVDQDIGSHASLQQLVARFDAYGDFLRDDAVTHFVAVTDDESEVAAMPFKTMMEGLLGHEFKFHSIASPPGSSHEECVDIPIIGRVCDTSDGCGGPHGNGAANGDTYFELSRMTGGRTFSICAPDWTPLFAELEAAVVVGSLLPCTFELPDPPAGLTFDRDQVNVVFNSAAGMETFRRVPSLAECVDGGWYYDDPAMPTEIRLCPGTCDRVESETEDANIDIELGCATILL